MTSTDQTPAIYTCSTCNQYAIGVAHVAPLLYGPAHTPTRPAGA
jgi:hypothetical protein